MLFVLTRLEMVLLLIGILESRREFFDMFGEVAGLWRNKARFLVSLVWGLRRVDFNFS